ncbi:hypothetical protein [Microbulbifer sp. ALW1]|uniref:hypothetical protein n=1 Tax=Microbulbifer sp. (strain ALW1) TaxID=1516059 RepID=UPI00135C2EDC|nr:hypothetical protein [Microbulbifer sp. ALW1]
MPNLFRLLLFLCLSPLATAEPQKLFEQVTPEEEQRIYQYNQPSIDRKIYYASRYRIVRVNTKLLESENNEFTLNPFEDQQMDVVTLKVNRDQSGGSIHWEGIWKDWERVTGKTMPTAKAPQSKPLEKDEIRRTLKIELRAYVWHFNPDTGEAINPGNLHRKYQELDGNDAEEHQKLKKISRHSFRTITGRFFILGGDSFVLTPLEFTPRYHLISIPNPDRYLGIDTPYHQLSEENQRRVREAQAFIDSLPPSNPNKKVLEDI